MVRYSTSTSSIDVTLTSPLGVV